MHRQRLLCLEKESVPRIASRRQQCLFPPVGNPRAGPFQGRVRDQTFDYPLLKVVRVLGLANLSQ